jgi:hypothetical protein
MVLCKQWGRFLALAIAITYTFQMAVNSASIVCLGTVRATRLRFTPLVLRGGGTPSPLAMSGIGSLGLLRNGRPLEPGGNSSVDGLTLEVCSATLHLALCGSLPM